MDAASVEPATLAAALLALGQDRYRLYTPGDNAVARVLLKAAIVLDPTSARAHALLAATYRQDATLLWTADPARAEARALRLAEHAVALARQEPDPQPSLPPALEQLGFVLLYQYDHAGCIQAAQEAIAHPSSSDQAKARALALWAHALTYLGNPTEALEYLAEAEALSHPLPFTIRYNKGHALAVQAYQTQQAGPLGVCPGRGGPPAGTGRGTNLSPRADLPGGGAVGTGEACGSPCRDAAPRRRGPHVASRSRICGVHSPRAPLYR